jgi:HEAT repeats
VSQNQQKYWRTTLDGVLKTEKDRGILGLVRVAILKNDPAGVKGNEQLLSAISAQLLAPEASARYEACQALAMIGEPANKTAQDLLDLITNPKEENSVVAAAIIAVSSMKSKSALVAPVLKKVASSHKSDDVKAYANEGIRILEGVDSSKPPLPKIGAPGVVPEKK